MILLSLPLLLEKHWLMYVICKIIFIYNHVNTCYEEISAKKNYEFRFNMKKIYFLIGAVAILVALFAIYFVLSDEKTLLLHPKGLIARAELELIITNIILMLIIIVPTYILLFSGVEFLYLELAEFEEFIKHGASSKASAFLSSFLH